MGENPKITSKDYLSLCHAAAYADIAARCAWLAYHYPEEYFCSVLNSYIDKAEKLQTLMDVCHKKGIKILPPNINRSQEGFSLADNGGIIYGLKGIRNVGDASKDIITERHASGAFATMQDFVDRMSARDKINKKIIEALIYSSALDTFEGSRNAKITVSAQMLKNAAHDRDAAKNGQMSLFDGEFGDYSDFKFIEIPDLPEFDKAMMLEKEKEYSGFYITAHPLDDYPKILNNKNLTSIASLYVDEEDSVSANTVKEDSKKVKIFGIMENLTWRRTKNNKKFVTFTISDKSGDINAIAFAECIDKYFEHFGEKNIVGITGIVRKDDFGVQLTVNEVKKF